MTPPPGSSWPLPMNFAESVRTVRERLLQRCAHSLEVQSHEDDSRLRLHLWRGAVVEDADQPAPVMRSSVLLPGRDGALAHREAAPASTEAPENGAGSAVHLVDRPGISGRDEQVAVDADVDRVDVEAVEVALVRRDARLVRVDVAQATDPGLGRATVSTRCPLRGAPRGFSKLRRTTSGKRRRKIRALPEQDQSLLRSRQFHSLRRRTTMSGSPDTGVAEQKTTDTSS